MTRMITPTGVLRRWSGRRSVKRPQQRAQAHSRPRVVADGVRSEPWGTVPPRQVLEQLRAGSCAVLEQPRFLRAAQALARCPGSCAPAQARFLCACSGSGALLVAIMSMTVGQSWQATLMAVVSGHVDDGEPLTRAAGRRFSVPRRPSRNATPATHASLQLFSSFCSPPPTDPGSASLPNGPAVSGKDDTFHSRP